MTTGPIGAPVTVVGAGISGLATAWYLTEQQMPVRVVDAGARPGGLIQTRHVPEGVIEAAARAFTWNDMVGTLFEAAGIPPVFAREESRRRYIFRGGRARRWPLSPVETLRTVARFGRAWLFRQTRPRQEETVAAWGARVLGPSATTWLLAPALQGIYGSPPAELSAPALFGHGRPRGGKLAAPGRGMGELMDGLHGALLRRGVIFEFDRTAGPGDIAAGPVAVCTSAPAASRLLSEAAPEFAAALGRIRMVSLLLVTAFFTPDPSDLRGFGILFPRESGVQALGAIFNADVFPGRSELRSETWVYGDLDPMTLPGSDDDAVARACADRERLTGRRRAPVAAYVTRQPRALPVYDAAVLAARTAARGLPAHLAVAGNYLGRLGVAGLLTGAAEAAIRLHARGADAAPGAVVAEHDEPTHRARTRRSPSAPEGIVPAASGGPIASRRRQA